MKVLTTTILLLMLMSLQAVEAKPTSDFLHQFIQASETARQPKATESDVDAFLDYFAEDFTDHHVAYGVSFEGKQHMKDGIMSYAKRMVSLSETVEDVILGSHTAVISVLADSKYYKDEQLKHFKGRNLLVLEFDEQGKISSLRRYLDH